MIKIDASNIIPKRFGTYLLGIIPGFFFEIILAFGDPALGLRLINRVRQSVPVSRVRSACSVCSFMPFRWTNLLFPRVVSRLDDRPRLSFVAVLRLLSHAWFPVALQSRRAVARSATTLECAPPMAPDYVGPKKEDAF